MTTRMAREMWSLTCLHCGKVFEREARLERHNRTQGKHGPFCGKPHAAAWAGAQQPDKVDQLIASRGQERATHGSNSMYRNGCRCEACRAAHAEKARARRAAS